MTRHISRLRASFLFLSLAACVGMAGVNLAWAVEADARFVAADVVKLRAAPSRDGEVVANLRINTRVIIMPDATAPAGWAKISVEIDPPLSGYAASAFLGTEKQTAGALLADYDTRLKAGDIAGAKTAAERLTALEPGKTEHAERLKGLYQRLGDAAGVQRIDDYLAGKSPKFIAYCPANGFRTVILLAEYQPGHGIVPLVPTVHEGALRQATEKTLTRLKLGLQRGPVFKMVEGESMLLDGAPLLQAHVVPQSKLGGTHLSEHVALGSRKLFCVGDKIISNEPMKRLYTEPIDGTNASTFTRDLRGDEGIQAHSATALRLPGGKPLISVEIDPSQDAPDKGLVPQKGWVPQGERFWRLFDGATGERLMERGFYYRSGPELQRVRHVQWFGWDRSGVRVGIVDYTTSFERSAGYEVGHRILLIVVDEQGTVHQQDLVLNWWQSSD